MQSIAHTVLVLAALSATPAIADKLPLPTAAYSADVVFESKGREYGGHMNMDGVKERLDITDANGKPSEKIIRRDLGKVFDLRPQRHLAVAMRIAAAEAAGETGAPGVDVDSFYGIEATPQGNETIAGMPTTKYAINVEAGPGLTVNAMVWATDDGIIVRATGKTSLDPENPPARMELRNIVRGPQDPSLFELPAGMSVLSLGGDSDTPEPQGGAAPAEATPATAPAPEPAAK
jgi:hypothetical protein